MTNNHRAYEAVYGVAEESNPSPAARLGRVEQALDEAEARGRKAEKKEIADTIQEMSNQTTFVLHCDGFTLAELIRNSPLGQVSEKEKK